LAAFSMRDRMSFILSSIPDILNNYYISILLKKQQFSYIVLGNGS
jgi:hypothetical protein